MTQNHSQEAIISTATTVTDHFAELSQFLGENCDIHVPTVILVGAEGAGKRTLLERLSMLEIFPKGNELKRMPIRLKMEHKTSSQMVEFIDSHNLSGSKAWIQLSYQELFFEKNKFFSASQLQNELHSFTEWLKRGYYYSPHQITKYELTIRVVSESVPNLTLVDLPGLISAHYENEPEGLKKDIKELTEQYLSQPNTLVLAIIPATERLRNSSALRLIQKHKKEPYTIGVLTKTDLVYQPEYFDSYEPIKLILSGTSPDYVPLKNGYIALKNRDTSRFSTVSLASAAEDESEWFSLHFPKEFNNSQVGVKSLLETITKTLSEYLTKEWTLSTPDLVTKAQIGINKRRENLNSTEQISSFRKTLQERFKVLCEYPYFPTNSEEFEYFPLDSTKYNSCITTKDLDQHVRCQKKNKIYLETISKQFEKIVNEFIKEIGQIADDQGSSQTGSTVASFLQEKFPIEELVKKANKKFRRGFEDIILLNSIKTESPQPQSQPQAPLDFNPFLEYTPHLDDDKINRVMCISSDPRFSHYSVEELRLQTMNPFGSSFERFPRASLFGSSQTQSPNHSLFTFGGPVQTPTSGGFNFGISTPAATPSTSGFGFGAPVASSGFTFGGFRGTNTNTGTSTSSASGFGSSAPTDSSAPTASSGFTFGGSSTTNPVTSTSTPSGFGGTNTNTGTSASSASPFGFGASSGSTFGSGGFGGTNTNTGTPASSASGFGSSAPTPTASLGFAFGGTGTVTTSPSPSTSGFGSSAPTPTTASGFTFGGPNTGASTPSASGFSSTGGFGGTNTNTGTSTSSASGFGSTASTDSSAPVASGFTFGGPSTTNTVTSTPSGFGGTNTNTGTSASSASGFGSTAPTGSSAPTTSGFTFGGTNTNTGISASSTSGFGSTAPSPTTSSAFTFGGTNTNTNTVVSTPSASGFGGTNTNNNTGTSTPSTSGFGSTPTGTPTSSASVFTFGGSSTSQNHSRPQASPSSGFTFGVTNTVTPSTSTPGFGSSAPTTSSGFAFGGTNTNTNTGTSTPCTSGFGSTAPTGTPTSSASGFGSSATTSGGFTFGGTNTVAPSASASGFGSTAPTSTFGGTNSNTNAVVSTPSTSGFGSTTPTSTTSSGFTFGGTNTNTNTVASTPSASGFGSTAPTDSGFTFGSAPAVGSSPNDSPTSTNISSPPEDSASSGEACAFGRATTPFTGNFPSGFTFGSSQVPSHHQSGSGFTFPLQNHTHQPGHQHIFGTTSAFDSHPSVHTFPRGNSFGDGFRGSSTCFGGFYNTTNTPSIFGNHLKPTLSKPNSYKEAMSLFHFVLLTEIYIPLHSWLLEEDEMLEELQRSDLFKASDFEEQQNLDTMEKKLKTIEQLVKEMIDFAK